MAKFLRGVEPLIANLKKIQKQYPDRVAQALYLKAQVLMTEAKRRTPVKTGVLRASGYVAPPEREGGRKISVEMGFGGAASDYAIPVHENLDAHHNPPGQAKYLESVLNEAAAEIGSEIAVEIHLNRKE